MRSTVNPGVVALGAMQHEVDELLMARDSGNYAFIDRVYKEGLARTVHTIATIRGVGTNAAGNSRQKDEEAGAIPTPSATTDGGEDRVVRFSDKWKNRGMPPASVQETKAISPEVCLQYDVPLELHSMATPVPDFTGVDGVEGGVTPTAPSSRRTTVLCMDWGDRYRSMGSMDMAGFRPMFPPPSQAQTHAAIKPEQSPENIRIDHQPPAVCEETKQLGDLETEADHLPEEDEKMQESHPEAAREGVKEVFKCELPPTGTDAVMEDDGKSVDSPVGEAASIVESVKAVDIEKEPKIGGSLTTIQKMKNLVMLVDEAPTALAAAALSGGNEGVAADGEVKTAKDVRSFVGCVKSTASEKGYATGKHKVEIPALKKAENARKQEHRREQARMERKKQMTLQSFFPNKPGAGAETSKTTGVKAAAAASVKRGSKRLTETQPSPNKKQRLETGRKNKKDRHPGCQNRPPPRQKTPIPFTSIVKEPVKERESEQYELTPAGMIAADTRTKRRERRREKHVPSWAEGMSLQNIVMKQRTIDPSSIFPRAVTLDPLRVFGTPDSMVMRNAAERTYRYEHRNTSSVDWTDEEDV